MTRTRSFIANQPKIYKMLSIAILSYRYEFVDHSQYLSTGSRATCHTLGRAGQPVIGFDGRQFGYCPSVGK